MPEYCEYRYKCDYFSNDGNDLCEASEFYNCITYNKKKG